MYILFQNGVSILKSWMANSFLASEWTYIPKLWKDNIHDSQQCVNAAELSVYPAAIKTKMLNHNKKIFVAVNSHKMEFLLSI